MSYNHPCAHDKGRPARSKAQRLASTSAFCPCCNGTGTQSPIKLTPHQHRVWAVVRRSQGLTAADIVRKVYTDRADGGPRFSEVCIFSAIKRANIRLAESGFEIARVGDGRDAVYAVRTIEPHRTTVRIIDNNVKTESVVVDPPRDVVATVDELMRALEIEDGVAV